VDDFILDKLETGIEGMLNEASIPGQHCGRNAIDHLRKAWELEQIDLEMAMFRALTAEEESSTVRSDEGSERPFWREIGVALRSRIAHYDFQKERFGFDRETFELVDLQATSAMPSTAERGTSP
jgi:hypothetical protein